MASLLMVGGDLTLYAQLQASVAMLDQLGIRLNYVATEDWLAKLSRDRGRGAEAMLINLPADLSLADQLDYLNRVWRCQGR